MPGFSGVGKVTSYTRSSGGLPLAGIFWGNCPSFKLSHSPNSTERNSSMSTDRGPLRRMTNATGVELEVVCDEFNKANLKRAVLGREDAGSAATGQSYTAPTGLVAGESIKLPHKNISNVTIVDSAGTPATLPPANYEVDAFDGSIRLIAITGSGGAALTQPFVVGYDRGAVAVMAGLAVAEPELYIGFSGINVDTGLPVAVDAYRVRFQAAEVIDWISNDYVDFTFKGTVLQDTTKQVSDVGGNYYKITTPTTVA